MRKTETSFCGPDTDKNLMTYLPLRQDMWFTTMNIFSNNPFFLDIYIYIYIWRTTIFLVYNVFFCLICNSVIDPFVVFETQTEFILNDIQLYT